MRHFVKVKNNPNLVRDAYSQAILNTNARAWEQFKKAREERLKTKTIIQDYETLKNDVNEMKEILKKVLDKLG